ncbi:hypothetical protein TNCV_47671 [Trichonephila clavipes]|nr:hypothetical protein TNCV_47671 [Trichonephila clavipes]
MQGTGEFFSPLQSLAKIMEVEIGGIAIYHPVGEEPHPPRNIPKPWQINNQSVEKTDCELETLWLVPIKQLLRIADLVWEVEHYVSKYFSDGATKIASLSRNCMRAKPLILMLMTVSTAGLMPSTNTGLTRLLPLLG